MAIKARLHRFDPRVLTGVLKFVYDVLQKEDFPGAVIAVLSTSHCVIDANRHLLLKPQQIVTDARRRN